MERLPRCSLAGLSGFFWLEAMLMLRELARRFALALRVLFNAAYAQRVAKLASGTDRDSALDLLAELQVHARIVDFGEHDIDGYDDAEIANCARILHAGVRRVLRQRVAVEPIRREYEGDPITVAAGFSAAELRLTGDVDRPRPCTGVLVHAGWRVGTEILVPAEVRL